MAPCHEHNRNRPASDAPKIYGLRLSLPEDDPMRPVLGDDWHQFHWFASEAEREAKIRQLTAPFEYYRRGDRPSFRIEKVSRDAAEAAGPSP